MADPKPDRESGAGVAEQLRRLRWALAVIAGAIAVQLTFVEMWLPRLVSATGVTANGR